MRVALLVFILLVIGLASCQEVNRRARLRSLINRARKGDTEARSTLRELRLKLQQRRNEAATTGNEVKSRKKIKPARTSTLEAASQPAPPTTTTTTTTTTEAPSKVEQVQRFPLFDEPIQTTRLRPRERVASNEPHRAVNRGLEVSSRTEQISQVSDVTGSRRAQSERPAPVQTTRRYAYFDEAGNYIFGYEAADGSFKEEIRGKDCVVHGKYGYIDPDGIRREYSYVSGNRCDPNAPPDAELVEAPPLNDQFLHQTQEKKLTQDEMNAFKQPSRRPAHVRRVLQRVPSQQSRVAPVETVVTPQRPRAPRPQAPRPQAPRPQAPRPQAPRGQHTSNIFPPFPGVKQEVQPKPAVAPKESRFPPFPGTKRVEPPPPLPPPPPRHQVAPVPTQRTQSSLITSDRNVINFDFDKEFSGLFTTFPATRHFQQPTHRPAPRPVVRPPVATPKPPPAVSFASRDFSQLRSADPNEPHQLVYDAASRTFKTVPLNSLVTLQQNNRQEPPSLAPFKPNSNPLPSVPLGGLTFGNTNRNQMSAKEFDNFFQNLKLVVKDKPL